MKLDEAVARLTHALATASEDQAAAVRTCLRRGAGLISLPAGSELQAPTGLVADRREAWVNLADALRIDADCVDEDWRDDAEWTPREVGSWEAVLAALVVLRRWGRIEETAAGLREQYPEDPARWQDTVREVIDLLNATRDTIRSRQIQHARERLEELLR